MMHIHQLDGCAPAPLAHYLKALGILRLVAEQADEGARGWWEDDHFYFASQLDQLELENFFISNYRPTPMFNPWGGRSGFYTENSEKKAGKVLKAIENSVDLRFEPYQKAVGTIRNIIQEQTKGKKPTDKDKDRLIMALRREVRGKAPLWLETVISLVGSGADTLIVKPALFGTGGNEGSGSYTSAYMAAIDEALLKANWNHAIYLSLFGGADSPQCSWGQSVGQFAPGGTVNPWDVLMAFEGACTLRSAVSVRNAVNSTRWMSSPFYVSPVACGYSSESRLDELVMNKGKELPGRGEQWFPLWSQPLRFDELSRLFALGRASTSRGRATDSWSMSRAITSFGTSQGIHEFLRYGYLQRNNQATHFAVPLGRFHVPGRRSPLLACLDDLEKNNWLRKVQREARKKGASSRFAQVERRLAGSLFILTQYPNDCDRWQTVIMRLTDLAQIQTMGSAINPGPNPSLRPDWVQAANDGSSEFRLALAFALQSGNREGNDARWWKAIRRHWLPLDAKHPWRFATTSSGTGQARLDRHPDVVMQGRKGVDDAIALVERRLIESAQQGERQLTLQAAPRAAAHASDLAELLAGGVDLDRTLALARTLMALDHKAWAEQRIRLPHPEQWEWPDEAWIAIRLSLFPWPKNNRSGQRFVEIADPAIVRRLASGDAATAVELALRRLRAVGVRCTVRTGTVSPATARLWAAALAFPINSSTAASFLRRLDSQQEI